MNVNTYVDILSFEINFVTLFHRCIYNWGLDFYISLFKDNKPIIIRLFFISSVGERPAARGGTTRPDEQRYCTNANIVTTVAIHLQKVISKTNPAPFHQETDCINTKIIKFIEKNRYFYHRKNLSLLSNLTINCTFSATKKSVILQPQNKKANIKNTRYD